MDLQVRFNFYFLFHKLIQHIKKNNPVQVSTSQSLKYLFILMNVCKNELHRKKNEFINSKNSKKKQYSSIFSKVNIIENI